MVKTTYAMLGLCAGLWLPAASSAQEVMPSALSETYESWQVSCVTPAAATDAPTPVRQCEMVQEQTRNDNGQRVLAIALRVSDDATETTIIAPLGLALLDGLSLMVGGEALVTAPFTTCVAGGCVAKISLDSDQMSRFEAAESISADIVGTQGESISLALIPAGFAAAWARLQVLDAESKAP